SRPLIARRSGRLSGRDGELPSEGEDRAGAAHTLKLVFSARLQEEARAVKEVACGARKEDLARPGERGYPRRRVNADAARLAADELDLARVETHANADPEIRDRGIHERRGAGRSRGAVEERQEAVAGGRDL